MIPTPLQNYGKISLPVGWTKPPSLTQLKADLVEAQSDHHAQTQKIHEWRNLLRPAAEKSDRKNVFGDKRPRSTYQAKLIRKQAEWRYPSLSEPFLSTLDLFKAEPYTHNDKYSAKQATLLLNHQFNHKIDKVFFIDTLIRSLVNNGTAIVKVAWKRETRKVVEKIPVYDFVELMDESGTEAQELAYWLDMFENDPDKFDQLVRPEWEEAVNMSLENNSIIVPVLVSEEEGEVEKVIYNAPSLLVCNPMHVVVDPTCKGDISQAKFIIHQYESCRADLRADGRYSNIDDITLSEGTPLMNNDEYSLKGAPVVSFRFSDEERQKVIVNEYWGYVPVDESGKLTLVLITWVGNTIIQATVSPFTGIGLPFVIVPYMPVDESVYGEADAELLGDNQKIISAVSRGVIDLMGRSANSQIGFRKDALDASNKERFQKGEDFEYNPNVDPTLAFTMLKFPEIPQSAQYMIDQHTAEAEALTGIKSFSAGISGNSIGNTATGVRSAMDATAKRDADILRRIASGVVKIGRMMLAMSSQFLGEEEVVRITDEEYVPVKQDDLNGAFDLRITISTAEEDNQKAEQLAFMLQTAGPVAGTELVKLVLSEIATLRKMPVLAKKIATFEAQPDPLAQKRAELELQMMEAEIELKRATAAKMMADAQIAPSKSVAEQAKARKYSSEADLRDLEFIEQEKGVNHARAIQAQQAQAMGNIALEREKQRMKANENKVSDKLQSDQA